jgi:hypothetical protein
MTGKSNEAMQTINECLQFNPTFVKGLRLRITMLDKTGEWNRSLNDRITLSTVTPGDRLNIVKSAILLLNLDRWESADHVISSLENDKNFQYFHMYLCRARIEEYRARQWLQSGVYHPKQPGVKTFDRLPLLDDKPAPLPETVTENKHGSEADRQKLVERLRVARKGLLTHAGMFFFFQSCGSGFSHIFFSVVVLIMVDLAREDDGRCNAFLIKMDQTLNALAL